MSLVPYAEPTAEAERSVVSTSPNDAAGGTGARKTRIVYFDARMNGPFVEDIALSGTTPVNTAATNIRFVEDILVIEAGSLRANKGNIELKTGPGGGGSTIIRIPAFRVGFVRAFRCHHYVAAGRRALIRRITAGITAVSANTWLRRAEPLRAGGDVDLVVAPVFRLKADESSFHHNFDPPIALDGPARIEQVVAPDAAGEGRILAGFSVYEVTP